MSLKRIAIEKLVEDGDFYPRNEVSSNVISGLVDAIEFGAKLPPIVVDSKTMKIVDGWHRKRAFQRLGAQEVMCDLRSYVSDGEMFREAVELNASHGRRLDTYDLRRSIMRMQELGIHLTSIASAVHVPAARIEEIMKGTANGPTEQVALKAGLRHLDGTTLTKGQQIAIKSVSGMQSVYHCNQLILLLENDLAPKTESFLKAMDEVSKLWGMHRKMYLQPGPGSAQ